MQARQARPHRLTVQVGDKWGNLKSRMARKLHWPRDEIHLHHGERELDSEGEVDPETWAIQIRRVRRPTGQAGATGYAELEEAELIASSPSPSPQRSAPTDSQVREEETIYFTYRTHQGVWRLPVHITDFEAADWEQVTSSMIGKALATSYPDLFGTNRRLSLAGNGMMLRANETMGQWVEMEADFAVAHTRRGSPVVTRRVHDQQPRVLPPDDLHRPPRTYGLPDMQAHFPILAAEQGGIPGAAAPMRISPTMIRVALLGAGDPVLTYVQHRRDHITPREFEQKLLRQLEDLPEGSRLSFCRRTGQQMEHDEHYDISREGVWWAVVHGTQGATKESLNIVDLAKDVVKMMGGKLKANQVKLLLRGEEGLCQRVRKQLHDAERVRNLMVSVAARYELKLHEGRSEHQQQAQSKETPWETVKPKRAEERSKRSGPPEASKNPEPVRETAGFKRFSLKASEWDQQLLDNFIIGSSGVLLESCMTQAQAHARQLCGTSQAIALVTVALLELYRTQKKITCTLIEQNGTGQKRERIVTAWLQNYGGQEVAHHDQVATVHVKQTTSTTVVVRARVKRAAITKQEWTSIHDKKTPVEIRKMLLAARKDLVIEDVFRLETTEADCTWLMRIQEQQLPQWLKYHDLPISFIPLGPSNDKFAIIWDKELTLMKELRAKYEQLPGYAGIVLTQTGAGARVVKEKVNDARRMAGLQAGHLYVIQGLPVDYSEQDLVPLMADLGWVISIVPFTRRTRGPVAQIKIRSETPPPKTVIRMVTSHEVITLQVREARMPERQEKLQERTSPMTWSEAAKQALGKDSSKAAAATNAVPEARASTSGTAQTSKSSASLSGKKKRNWADEADTVDDEILWDLWGDTYPWEDYPEEMSDGEPEAQAVSVDNDSYVEDAEPRKRQKIQMKHKGSAHLRSRRMRSLEQGLATVQGQLAQLMQSLHAVAPTSVGAGPAGRRGRIPWPQGVTLDESQILRSPGDGDCLWHSVAQALRPQSQPYSVEQGEI